MCIRDRPIWLPEPICKLLTVAENTRNYIFYCRLRFDPQFLTIIFLHISKAIFSRFSTWYFGTYCTFVHYIAYLNLRQYTAISCYFSLCVRRTRDICNSDGRSDKSEHIWSHFDSSFTGHAQKTAQSKLSSELKIWRFHATITPTVRSVDEFSVVAASVNL